MPDPTNTDADRFDDWLNADSRNHPRDDLTDFTLRVMREAALPNANATEPTRDQRNRITATVFGRTSTQSATVKENSPMTTHALSANGTAPVEVPARTRDQSSSSRLSALATAALVVVLAVAAFGLFRNAFDFSFGPGSNTDPAGAPGIAFQPNATPSATSSCDADRHVPVFEGAVPDVETITTYILLDEGGTLTLHCDDSSETLATDIKSAWNLPFTSTSAITVVTNDDAVRLLNVVNGASISIDAGPRMLDGEVVDGPFYWVGGPWFITPANVEQTDWRITDLRSMDSLLLSEEIGGVLPAGYKPFFDFAGSSVTVVTWKQAQGAALATPETAASMGQFPSDNAALVLPGSIEDRRWIDLVEFGRRGYVQPSFSQSFSVGPDGTLLAYTTVTDTSRPVIRIEHAIDGEHMVDVAIDEIGPDTSFMLAGSKPHLVTSDGETRRTYALIPDVARMIDEQLDPEIARFLPTSDPDTILATYNDAGTSVSPINVVTGAAPEFYVYVPSIVVQVTDGGELPANVVRIGQTSDTDTSTTIQLVNPSTGEVVLESVPVDAHPIELINEPAFLRNHGSLAVVTVTKDRVIVMNAQSGEVWEMNAPVDDGKSWWFYPSPDGQYITATRVETLVERSSGGEYFIAALTPDATWIPYEPGSGNLDQSNLLTIPETAD